MSEEMKVRRCDRKCKELAEYFLSDAELDVKDQCVAELAQVIQDRIELWMDTEC